MDQRFIAGDVSVGVVEALEIVQVEHRHAQCIALAVDPGEFPIEDIVQAAPVQAAGELIFAYQFAHLFQLRFEFVDPAFGQVHFAPGLIHFIARAQGFGLRGAGFDHDVVENLVELLDVRGQADLLGILIDLFVILAGAGRHRTESVNEGQHHAFYRDLGFRQAVLQQPLLVDDFLQAGRGVAQGQVGDGAGQHRLHVADLAMQPAVFFYQFGDVFQQQAKQLQQQLLLFGQVAAFQVEFEAEFFQPRQHVVQGGFATRFLGGGGQCFGIGDQFGRIEQQGRQAVAQGARQHVAQQPHLGIGVGRRRLGCQHGDAIGRPRRCGRRLDCGLRRQVRAAQGVQDGAVVGPVARLQGAFQLLAERCDRRRHGDQQPRKICHDGFGARFRCDADDLVVDVTIIVRRRCDARSRQTAEGLARDFGRILWRWRCLVTHGDLQLSGSWQIEHARYSGITLPAPGCS